jgi:hypothetical protein
MKRYSPALFTLSKSLCFSCVQSHPEVQETEFGGDLCMSQRWHSGTGRRILISITLLPL